jgi:hypothetical protein
MTWRLWAWLAGLAMNMVEYASTGPRAAEAPLAHTAVPVMLRKKAEKQNTDIHHQLCRRLPHPAHSVHHRNIRRLRI